MGFGKRLRKRVKKLAKKAKKLPGIAIIEKGREKLSDKIKDSPEAVALIGGAAAAFGGPAGAAAARAAFGGGGSLPAGADPANMPESAGDFGGAADAGAPGEKGKLSTPIKVALAVGGVYVAAKVAKKVGILK